MITLGWSETWAILGVVALVLGAAVELYRTRTPRAWWYDLDKRADLMQQRTAELARRVKALEEAATKGD